MDFFEAFLITLVGATSLAAVIAMFLKRKRK